MKHIKLYIVCLILIITIIVFAIVSCGGFNTKDNHEHSFEYIFEGETHLKKYTCGCSSLNVPGFHFDEDLDDFCDKCNSKIDVVETPVNKSINTEDNYVFFPTEKSDLNRQVLKDALITYSKDNNCGYENKGDFEIFNFITKDDSEKYSLDIFQAVFSDCIYYFVKHGVNIYYVDYAFASSKSEHCITNIAITDINGDEYIEILVGVANYQDEEGEGDSQIVVIDTYTEHSVTVRNYDYICYLKENENGIVSIYHTNGIIPTVGSVKNGKLDESYYDLANDLFESPTLNTANYKFASYTLNAACDLYSAEITISDATIKFPYLFKNSYYGAFFEVNVKMTYLGKTFSYVNSNTYLDGAVVTFVNANDKITFEGWNAGCALTEFKIQNGMIIDRTYRYNEYLGNLNAEGMYDMVITYKNKAAGIEESIVIENFLILTR